MPKAKGESFANWRDECFGEIKKTRDLDQCFKELIKNNQVLLVRSISNCCSSPPTTQVYRNLKKSYEKNWSLVTNNPNLARIFTNAHIVAHRKDKSLKGRQCTSYWCYVIGTGPPSPRSKLSFLSFCDQNPWKDIKSSIVFLEFVSMDDLTFRQK